MTGVGVVASDENQFYKWRKLSLYDFDFID